MRIAREKDKGFSVKKIFNQQNNSLTTVKLV